MMFPSAAAGGCCPNLGALRRLVEGMVPLADDLVRGFVPFCLDYSRRGIGTSGPLASTLTKAVRLFSRFR